MGDLGDALIDAQGTAEARGAFGGTVKLPMTDVSRPDRILDRGLLVFRRAHARDPGWRRLGEIYDGVIGSLRRFKEDVREVREGFECGISIENFNDLKVGDLIECYRTEEVARTL